MKRPFLLLAASLVAVLGACQSPGPLAADIHSDLVPERPGTPELRYYLIADT